METKNMSNYLSKRQKSRHFAREAYEEFKQIESHRRKEANCNFSSDDSDIETEWNGIRLMETRHKLTDCLINISSNSQEDNNDSHSTENNFDNNLKYFDNNFENNLREKILDKSSTAAKLPKKIKVPNEMIQSLVEWSLLHNITLSALDNLLVRLNEYLDGLPLKSKTILHTPRTLNILSLDNGSYTYMEIEVVPIKWINKDKTKCFWPYYKSTDRVKKAILSIEIPDPNKWNEYATRILHKYDTYQEARSHLSKAEYTSHLDSEENNNNEHRIKRKRIAKIYSSSEESLVLTKPKRNKNKSRLRSPPKIRSPDKYTLAREGFTVNYLEELPRVRNVTENVNENFTTSLVPTTSINDNKNSESFELLILKKLRKLDYIQNNVIIPDLDEILSFLRPQGLEAFQETNVPTLPIDNEIQLNEFEQYISITENYKNMILKFSRVGGHSAAGITRKILKNLISSKFAMNFNWGGRAPKRPFKELKSKDLLLDSVHKAIPSISTHEIESVIKDWLKQAKTRVMSLSSS